LLGNVIMATMTFVVVVVVISVVVDSVD
jgi:hypothetical protein